MSNLNVERQSSNTSNDKSAKYDRQLRLWGNHGQDNLENSRICLINASAAGTETLKNMVLPGVGYFTILDENSITEEDLANKYAMVTFYLK
jgi:amyloid beta precursor protein binding protein 1